MNTASKQGSENLEEAAEKLLGREAVAREKAEELREDFGNNSKFNSGAEVEDLVFRYDEVKQQFEEPSNEEAEEFLLRVHENTELETEPEYETVDGEEVLKSVKVKESPFQVLDTDKEFKAEFDHDLGPRQREVATDVVSNPADLIFALEYYRRKADENMGEFDAFEIGLSPEIAFSDIDGENNLKDYILDKVEHALRRPGKRYEGLHREHGGQFNVMKTPTATQVNSGLPVSENASSRDEDYTLVEMIFWLENGGESPALSDVSQSESAVFDADPIVKEDDGEYNTVIESGREMLYDLFIAESEAASREEVDERWGEELEKALPSNNNYARLETTRDADTVEDWVEAVMTTKGIMSPDIPVEDIYDRHTGDSLEEELDDEETWVIFDNSEMEKDLGEAMEEGFYKARVLMDGELREVEVRHEFVDEYAADGKGKDPEDIEKPGDGREAFEEFTTFDDYMERAKSYVEMQSTFVRPDIALKMNGGIAEGRNYSNSPRTLQAVLDQKGLLMKIPDIQEQYEKRMNGEESRDFREAVNKEGLDTDFLDESLRDLQRENVDIKAEGLRSAFNPELLPYTFETVALDYLQADEDVGFDEFLRNNFDDLEEFLDYQVERHDRKPNTLKQGTFTAEDWEEEYEQFQEWFVETAYEDPMETYLQNPTVNQQLVGSANRNGSREAYSQFKRT